MVITLVKNPFMLLWECDGIAAVLGGIAVAVGTAAGNNAVADMGWKAVLGATYSFATGLSVAAFCVGQSGSTTRGSFGILRQKVTAGWIADGVKALQEGRRADADDCFGAVLRDHSGNGLRIVRALQAVGAHAHALRVLQASSMGKKEAPIESVHVLDCLVAEGCVGSTFDELKVRLEAVSRAALEVEPRLDGLATPQALDAALAEALVGSTPWSETQKVLDQLLRAGAVLQAGPYTTTVLHHLAERTTSQISNLAERIEWVLAQQPNLLNARNEQGDTALHVLAASLRDDATQCIELLLDRGAQVGLKNLAGQTPGDLTRFSTDARIGRLLKTR